MAPADERAGELIAEKSSTILSCRRAPLRRLRGSPRPRRRKVLARRYSSRETPWVFATGRSAPARRALRLLLFRSTASADTYRWKGENVFHHRGRRDDRRVRRGARKRSSTGVAVLRPRTAGPAMAALVVENCRDIRSGRALRAPFSPSVCPPMARPLFVAFFSHPISK